LKIIIHIIRFIEHSHLKEEARVSALRERSGKNDVLKETHHQEK
jgi:hypothetical protein